MAVDLWTKNVPNQMNNLSDATAKHENMSQSDPIENKAIQTVFCLLYTMIFLIGVFGNSMVCYAVVKNKAMQSVTNLFITNLALSDILMCLLAVPFTPLYTFLGRWAFGSFLCHVMPYAQGCSVYISTLTLTSIAVDRFFVIIYPFKQRMKIWTCLGLIISIWIFALLATFPYGYYMELQDLYCEENWPSNRAKKIFSTVTTFLQFVVPFVVMAFCYTCVCIKLNDRFKTRPGSKIKEDADKERKKRTNRMLIAMVSIFGMSWLPLNLINICADFYILPETWKYNMMMFFIAHCIAMSSTCYNPFLYAWLNENFRKEFKQILPFLDVLVNRANGNSTVQVGHVVYHRRKSYNANETIQETLMSNANRNPPTMKQIEREFHEKMDSVQPLVETTIASVRDPDNDTAK